jgi:DNA sulfur modification protein DndC
MSSDQINLPECIETDSKYGSRQLSELHEEIRQIYLSDNRPWVIGYSGGKDSTTALQLVWYALTTLPKQKLIKPIYVISSDTLVETPLVVDHIHNSLKEIQKKAEELSLPIYANLVKPKLNDTFWVNLLGKGYPIPYTRSRWCTDRLKISPANRFILDKVAEHGEVLLVLGVRKAESVTRAQVINMRSIKGTNLKSHTSLPGAFVYPPIVDFSIEDVWNYLLQVPSPWGKAYNNQYLFDLYKSANSAECPLVIDNTTPSCGNSRFGCWACTVVNKDHSMESLIKSGEDWMKPLLKFRNILSELNNPARKHLYRDHRRRDGKVYFKKGLYNNSHDQNEDDKSSSKIIAWGQTRIDKGLSEKAVNLLQSLGLEVKERDKEGGLPQILLRELLKVHVKIQETRPDISIISIEELENIRTLWKTEQNDWIDQVPIIHFEATGQNLDWIEDDVTSFGKDARNILNKICRNNNIPVDLVVALLDLEKQHHGMSRRSNIYKKIDAIFRKDWRSIEEVQLDN